MSDKYAALRAAAERAKLESNDEWGYDTDAFHDEATPETILALLADREADKAQIAELTHNHRVHAAKLISERGLLKQRIAELEARKVKLPSLNPQMFNDDVMFGYRKAQKEAVEFCAAAGITLETGV